MKKYLTGYKLNELQSLNTHGLCYTLKIKVVKFFGLIKRVHKQQFIIPYGNDTKAYEKFWDGLIADKRPLP